MGIEHKILVSTLSILSCLGVLASPAWAKSRQINYTLSQGNQTFAALMQQAESLSKNLVEQELAQASVTEVTVTIMGEHNGQEVPLLFSRVSRSNWQKEPRIQPWTRYVTNSAIWLGFLNPEVSQPVAKSPVLVDQVSASMSDTEPNFYQEIKRRQSN